ncbi:UNVERIFIED_CONTAM: Cysteine-rich protein 2-binding protein, partial [Siphonaria sp. JEL0065]
DCGGGSSGEFNRLNMTWLQLTHLVLYHLTMTSSDPNMEFYGWKDHICGFIDQYWDHLVPGRVRTPTWFNTIAKELSTNSAIFISGKQQYNAKGFWALTNRIPPQNSKMPKEKNERVKQEKRAVDKDSGGGDGAVVEKKRRKKDTDQDSNNGSTSNIIAPMDYSASVSPAFVDSPASSKSKPRSRKKKESADAEFVPPLTEDQSAYQHVKPEPVPLSVNHHRFAGKQPRKNASVLGGGAKSMKSVPLNQDENEEEENPTPTSAKPTNQIRRLNPEESYTLIQKCEPLVSLDPTVARLRRRLLVIQAQKLRHLKRLDIDVIAARSVKEYRADPEPMQRVPLDDGGVKYDLDVDNKAVIVYGKQDVEFDKCIAERTKLAISHKVISIPPPFNLSSKVYGTPFNATTLTTPTPVVSQYTGNMLKPYIWRDYLHARKPENLAPQYKILEFFSSLNERDGENVGERLQSIDYVYFHPMHRDQVNEMLSRQFWPGIDVSEHLSRPDLSVIALYKKVVIGCAFIMPDGYISYIMVRPGWQRAGIATFMLYHLIQAVESYGKDVTLHVSANNRAMMLYQSFGFKAEEFIVNFYD